MDGVNCNMADSFTFLSFFLPLSLFLLSHLALPFPVQEPQPFCPPFEYCGDLFDIQPPFTAIHKPKCGLYAVNCDDKMKPTIKFEDEGKSYVVKKILYEQSTLVIQDEDISNHSPSDFCNFLYNFTVPPSLLHFHLKSPNHTFVNCNRGHQPLFNDSYMGVYNYTDCEDRIIYYWPEDLPLLHHLSPLQLHHCSVTHFPLSLDLVDPDVPNDLFRLLDFGFGLQWNRTQENGKKPTIKFEGEGRSYAVKEILYEESTLVIQDEEISNHSPSDFCNFLYNFTMPPSPIHPLFLNAPNYTFVNCKGDHQPLFNDSYKGVYNYTGCEDRIIYYWPEDLQLLHDLLPFQLLNCSVTHFPLSLYDLVDPDVPNKLFSLLKFGFGLLWNRTQKCKECQEVKKGFCGGNHLSGDFNCFPMPRVLQTLSNQPGLDNPTERNEGHSGEKSSKKKRSINWKILIGVGTVIGGFLLTSLILILYFRYCKKRYPSLSFNVLSRAISSFPNCNSEIGSGIQTQFFSYKELEEATNNFDPSKELGDGGFGTVYHGKLWDGRFVAIKRLYQNNHRRVEQFKNEVNILSRLRHQNLVTLYGCSSRHSRVLLLVYEFIPNGTVAYHLHGDGAKTNKLTWSTRMCIAIETADALAYLHNVEIIHRDVKTDNILLDNNFCVKVADFGLSRLFPLDVTHVSTVPQGTPGYVDPDYHRCYQLTDRSDVYSFGVVLIELVSSLPAVDISRHRHEINLANMAINKIQNDALHELVDPTLGFDSDISVRRMITSVAELAFRCLQDEKEVRPSMEEVLEELRGISGEKYNAVKTEEAGTPMDDIC